MLSRVRVGRGGARQRSMRRWWGDIALLRAVLCCSGRFYVARRGATQMPTLGCCIDFWVSNLKAIACFFRLSNESVNILLSWWHEYDNYETHLVSHNTPIYHIMRNEVHLFHSLYTYITAICGLNLQRNLEADKGIFCSCSNY